MIDVFEVIAKNKLSYRHKLVAESPEVIAIGDLISSGSLDFHSNMFRRFDGRLISQYKDLSPENIVLLHLKHQLRKTFRVNFSNRNSIIEEMFDKLRCVRSLKDFTIIRFDFRKYFYSVSTRYIYDNYISSSKMSREDKDYIDSVCQANAYCVAGVPIFNYFIEIISKDFDQRLKARLQQKGLVYYARYVDDGVAILNTYLPKRDARKIITEVIKDIFYIAASANRVCLNEDKFEVITRRYSQTDCSFEFLGYEFFLCKDFDEINIGITEKKRKKYQEKINRLIKNNYVPGDAVSEERVRQLIKAHSSRVVYYAPSAKHKGVWVSKGIIANYNKIKDCPNNIDRSTKSFLNDIYRRAFRASRYTPPYYLNNDRYSLRKNLLVNRAMIFNQLIGMPKSVLLNEMAKVHAPISSAKDYDHLVKDYLIHIKIGY